MIKVYPTGWYYRKDDKHGNVELKNKYTGEVIKQINGGSWDNYTIIHAKKDGSFFVKNTEQLDACMYVACHRDGDSVYSENWQEEGRKMYGHMSLEELIIAFHEAGTPKQTAGLLEVIEELGGK